MTDSDGEQLHHTLPLGTESEKTGRATTASPREVFDQDPAYEEPQLIGMR
jgi:hypothetical protein